MKAVLILAVLVSFVSLGATHPTEASGQVVHVVDGDTFDVMIEQADRDLGADKKTRGRGACQVGRDVTNFTRETVADEWIYLDLDDKTGQDRYGWWVAVAYLHKGTEDGHAPEPVYPCFNRVLVDSGHAQVKDFTNQD